MNDLGMLSDVPCLEVPCIPSITACYKIVQEREPLGFHAGEELVMRTYSSIFEPTIHKV
jgi:hypothetical protein